MDRWKGAVSAVDTAEYGFRSTGLVIELLRRTDGIANSLERIEDPKHGMNADTRLAEERINWTAGEQSLAIAEELLSKLGEIEGHEATLVQSSRDEGVRYDHSIREAAHRLGSDPDPVMLASEMLPLTLQGMHYEQSVAVAVKAAREVAVTRKEEAKRSLSFSNWLSYLLYTLGWSIGLAGQLFGPRKKSSPE